MSKANRLYVGTLVSLVIGLWGILSWGRHLSAPYHLAGLWKPVDAGPGAEPFTISQSGRFLKLRRDDRIAIDLRWDHETHDAFGERIIRLSGEGQSVEVRLRPVTRFEASAVGEFRFTGRFAGSWTATHLSGVEPPVPDPDSPIR